MSHLCALTATHELTCPTEYLAEAATQTDTCWCKENTNVDTEREHKSIVVSQAFVLTSLCVFGLDLNLPTAAK